MKKRFPGTYPPERALLVRVAKKQKWGDFRIQRKSEKPFDIAIEGTTTDGMRFIADLKLAAIRSLTNWTSEEIADMSDYPSMVMQGDWSGIRDSSSRSIAKIFYYGVIKGRGTKKIPRSTARAMVRAGLPLSRSELRGNPFTQSQKDMFRIKRASARGYRTFYKDSSKTAGSYQYTQLDRIVDAIKNLKKRNYNDEMIESVVVKERPGRPRDFIIIVKHRYFVNGSRIYSAGLKTEETIEKFVPIIGTKKKRIGNSDYVFNIYGVRFPEAIKKKPGKLFDNPKSFPNIDKSGFHKGEYVGYSPKAVNVFSITKSRLVGWQAMGEIYKTNPPGKAWKVIYGKSLAEISKALENL